MAQEDAVVGEELAEGQEPEFPHEALAKLDEMISRPRWVVPVLPKGELEILLDAAIALAKKGNLARVYSEAGRKSVYNPGFDFCASKNVLISDECVFS